MTIEKHQRIVICGGPHTGKTTLACKLYSKSPGLYALICTDDFINEGSFSQQSEKAANYLGHYGHFIMEGVTTVRALRKWMLSNKGKPCDKVIHLITIHTTLTPGQATLGVGCETVWREIEPMLRKRGVIIEEEAK